LVDVLALLYSLGIYIVTCLMDAFRSGQIHKMKLRNAFNVSPQFLRLNLNAEDTVRASRCVILRRLRNDSVSIADEK